MTEFVFMLKNKTRGPSQHNKCLARNNFLICDVTCPRKISKVANLRPFAKGMLTLAKLFAKMC